MGSRKAIIAAFLGFSITIGVHPSLARAGGFEIPDNGTQALGRGGAFTAKADDPTAIHHNVGGLAQQRGTRVLVNTNISQSSMSFQREGSYPDDPNNPATPWGGSPYPKATNEGGPVVLPFIAATTDLGLDWMTLAIGTHAPPASAFAGRYFPLAIDGKPNPARYDAVGGTSSVILFHTAAVGVRLGEAIDIGAAFHLVQASIQTRTVSYVDVGGDCAKKEHQLCDGRGEGEASGWTATGSVGALARLGSGFTAGAHVRGPVVMNLDGMSKTISPRIATSTALPDSRRSIQNAFPWVVRTGVRKAFKQGAFEAGDVELDLTYERWSDAQNPGIEATFEKLGPSQEPAKVTVVHGYKDTMSVRLGGAYNTLALGTPLTLRAGAFYDSSATDPILTRVDVDTLAKIAGTVGVGLKVRGFTLELAYASVFDVSRTVEGGVVRPVNGAKAGATVDAEGRPLGAVNNGAYSGHTHIASVGVVMELDRVFGWGKPSSTPKDERPPPSDDSKRDQATSAAKGTGKGDKQRNPHAS
jgi:long-subunit fatty acid transport protein